MSGETHDPELVNEFREHTRIFAEYMKSLKKMDYDLKRIKKTLGEFKSIFPKIAKLEKDMKTRFSKHVKRSKDMKKVFTEMDEVSKTLVVYWK